MSDSNNPTAPYANRLAAETSPYLLQHRDNPVHWWAWGPAPLAEARRTGKPILLSIGYAACHWCHVMAHESFENPETASLMNDLFVNIKVDREERPDIDAIYMGALHQLGEQGGWPLTMFLDSDGKPFWGGTYFPPEPRWGKPSFSQVLREIARLYREEPDKVAQNASGIIDMLRPRTDPSLRLVVSDDLLANFTNNLVRAFDPEHGGLKGAPKFPQWSIFWLLWRGGIRYGNAAARQTIEHTLVRICQGGIYDHLGGGFARYSVDERWLAPHFEKMLYDNALLIDLMTEVWRETRNPLFKVRVEETVGWLSREMIADGGGFAASLDADSEGEEGKFYVWSAAEIGEVLGSEDASFFAEVYDVTSSGNWASDHGESHTILNRLKSPALRSPADEARLAALRQKLLERREQRPRPGWDDKVLADWNGLMIAALARASQVFDQPGWRDLAISAFDFISTSMQQGSRLLHAFRAGRASAPATASDYANMIWAAIRLYEATGERRFLDRALNWSETLHAHYWVAEGGFAFTADDTPDVIVQLRMAQDDATPNANAIQLTNLVHVFMLTADTRYLEWASAIPQAFAADIQANAAGHAGLLASTLDLLEPRQVVIIGAGTSGESLATKLFGRSLPGVLQLVWRDEPLAADTGLVPAKRAINGQGTAYVCAGMQCSAAITDPNEFVGALEPLRSAPFIPQSQPHS